jgi:hypothetical protein
LVSKINDKIIGIFGWVGLILIYAIFS